VLTVRRAGLLDGLAARATAGLAVALIAIPAAACNQREPTPAEAETAAPQPPPQPQQSERRTPAAQPSEPANLAQSSASAQASLSAYEEIRAQLARDEIGAAVATAARLERAAREATGKAPEKLRPALEKVASSAKRLAATSKDDASKVRRAFGDVSEAVVALLAAEPGLRKGRYIFECPMAQGYKNGFRRMTRSRTRTWANRCRPAAPDQVGTSGERIPLSALHGGTYVDGLDRWTPTSAASAAISRGAKARRRRLDGSWRRTAVETAF
jgi:hypothetical protein